jgi:hypothetical protein
VVAFIEGEILESNAQSENTHSGTDTTGFIIAPMAAAAALDSAAFSRVNASEAVPATWEERARKPWEYYVEEPLVKNCVNSWRTFAMGDEMDMKSGLVVPFYVTVETHGTDGQVLKVEDKVKEVKEDIVVALGLSRSLVTGDGPNYATRR